MPDAPGARPRSKKFFKPPQTPLVNRQLPKEADLARSVKPPRIRHMAAETKEVTLRDVAARAGVSIATASVAIAGKSSGTCCVSEPVAERIRLIAKWMGYRPNIHAQRLSRRDSRTIALIIKSSIWHNIMWSIGAVQKTFKEKGYEEIFCMHPNSLEQEARHLERCLEARVRGILIFPLLNVDGRTNAAKYNEIHEIEKVPLVQIGIALPGCRAPSVIADEQRGVYDVVRQLAELGHRRIAHVTLDGYGDSSFTSPFLHAHHRFRGYQEAMEELGLKQQVAVVDPLLSFEDSFESVTQLARRLVSGRGAPTAIIVYSDSLAAAAMRGVRQAGLRVPKDVSIVGVDKSAFTDVVRPRLSMVILPHDELGAIGSNMLLDMIDGKPAKSVQIRAAFDQGRTIAAPRARSRAAAVKGR
jgi:DNA-binding LacI/PurR family transcriptional regulator